MKLRVNLLRDNEARYQGPVSLRFALVAGGATVGAILLIMMIVAVQRHISMRHNLAYVRAEWQRLEPQFRAVQKKQQDLRQRQALLNELGLWHTTRESWSGVLRGLQAIVPPSVQLTRMNIAGSWDFVASDKPAPAPDQKPPPVPARRYELDISGSAAGDLADETVVQFTRAIRDSADFRSVFDAVRLQRMSREGNSGDQKVDRVFEIEGQSKVRMLR